MITEESINSALIRWGEDYSVLALQEKYRENPDNEKIAALRKRALKVSTFECIFGYEKRNPL